MDLNKLAKEAYENAKAHGWHEEEHSDKHYLALILTEAAEAVQADRKGEHADVEAFEKNSFSGGFQDIFARYIKSTVEEELSDIVIRCLDLARLRKIDLRNVNTIIGTIKGMKEHGGLIDLYYVLSGIATCQESTDGKIVHIIACVLSYCKFKGIEIEWFIEQKMKYNRLRPYMHGGKKY